MSAIESAQQFAEVLAPTGDSLLFRSLRGREEVGKLPCFQVEWLSDKTSLNHRDFLGQPCTVKFPTASGDSRHLGGVVSRFERLGRCETIGEGNDVAFEKLYAYKAELRPWFWLLTRTLNCRIFENLSVVDIIEKVLGEYDFASYELRLSETYSPQEYCVQYRESDADFVIRLMAETGIYFFFKYEADHDVLVIADSISAHEAFPGYSNVPFNEASSSFTLNEESLTQWVVAYEVMTSGYTHTDYNFTTPQSDLTANTTDEDHASNVDLEVFDYPGNYEDSSSGEALAKIVLEERQTGFERYTGRGACRGFAAGYLTQLAENPLDDDGQEYLVIGVEHEITHASFQGGDDEISEDFKTSRLEKEMIYRCRVEAVTSEIPWRLPHDVPRPRIEGPQTAVVIADDDDAEIWTDQYGRIKVTFHWDRRTDEKPASCWLRVAQGWAGKSWGEIRLPRIGQEVVVSFLNGDPDRPLVTGCVYNASQMPPNDLPDTQTRSVFRTRSTPDGTPENFHELSFEDQKDSEQIYFHSERDFLRDVENDDVLKVGFEKKDPGNQSIDIFNNRTITVGTSEAADGSQSVTIFNNDTLVVGNDSADDGSQTIDIWNNRTITVHNGDDKLTVEKGNRAVTVSTGDDTRTISKGNRETTISKGNDTLTVSAGNHTSSVAKGNYEITLSSGDYSLQASGGSIKIEAAQEISFTCGGSSIKITPSGVEIAGPQVQVKADSSLTLEGGATLEAKGGGMATIKGGIVQIN